MKKIKKPLFIFIFLCMLGVIVASIVFSKNVIKLFKTGNNMSNQEVVDYILNISSYETNITVEVKSNKNSNKYILNQKFASPNISSQEVLEPSNIAGIKIINDGNTLKLENSLLSLNNVYENYSYLGDNCLDLKSFIEDYKADSNSNYYEENGKIVMTTKSKLDNKYIMQKILYVDSQSAKPINLEIKDYNQNTLIYILYNKVELNNTETEDVIAFNWQDIYNEI
jgi:hypothetical protein